MRSRRVIPSYPLTFFSSILLCHYHLLLSAAGNSISTNQSITDGESIISSGQVFRLGFFSPPNSSLHYIGIWYNDIPDPAIVWVANRENPLPDSSGSLRIQSDGNLVILDGRGQVHWSANTSTASPNNPTATLEDTGNLVLRSASTVLWQSFDDPTDTLLPTMRMSLNPITYERKLLTSWKSAADPSPGSFTFGMDPRLPNQFFIWQRSVRYWRSGTWNGRTFDEIDGYNPNFNISLVGGPSEVYFVYTSLNNSKTRIALDPSGHLNALIWNGTSSLWDEVLSTPKENCSVYAACGPYGVCNENLSPNCRCLQGFEPLQPKDWNSGIFTGGCRRKTPTECGKEDSFLRLRNMKLADPESTGFYGNGKDCPRECLDNCRCRAYVYTNWTMAGTVGCLILEGELRDLREEDEGGRDIYVRLTVGGQRSESGSSGKKRSKLIVVVTVSVSALAVLLGSLGCCLWKKHINAVKGSRMNMRTAAAARLGSSFHISKIFQEAPDNRRHGIKRRLDVPAFDYEAVATATNNFSIENKLGQGGFGPVFMGKFPGGREIAVKTLSSTSGQGLEEFKNEVVLIAKLQHRNLVRLLGYCIRGEEKMLLYEYMANRSLNFFLFDDDRRNLLDGNTRFKIIMGIARGLLYLHEESRLRIIHRDLKASNILLDEEMNPKISDFGTARLFGGDQSEANTSRVVGTYGYMSPEYALDGLFSVKSDVFSFGVLLLEIISGKKNRSFQDVESSLSLIGYAWRLWKEGRELDFMDQSLGESCSGDKVGKCIQVGLLCVQKETADRPSMASVVVMLANEAPVLQVPKEPAFCVKRRAAEVESSSNRAQTESRNEVTVSVIEGR